MTSVKTSPEEKFFFGLIEFWKVSLGGIADAVRQLSRIQSEFPNQYESFRRINKEPNLLFELASKLSPEEKGILFEVFLRASTLSQRSQTMLDSTKIEKRVLARDIEKFSMDLKDKLLLLRKK